MKTPRQHRAKLARQRGSVLVLVLGVTSLVGVIGLSSLLAVRLQHRDVQSRADAAQAQQLADSGLQLLHARLSDNDNWRNEHTHDTWSADESLGGGSQLRYKLLDEGDGNDVDLADDANDAARLIVRVAHGEAVRLASIQIAGGALLGPELVTNGDMESGATGYSKTLLAGYFNSSTVAPHGGNMSMIFQGRLTSLDGWKQSLLGSIEREIPYRVSVCMRMQNFAETTEFGFYYSRGLLTKTDAMSAAVGTNWTQFSATITPDQDFDPTTLYVYGRTTLTTQNIHFDDLSVRQILSENLPLVRGSYRRELDN